MPPKDGITVARFITVADIERSLRFYETVFGGRNVIYGTPTDEFKKAVADFHPEYMTPLDGFTK